MVYLFFDDELRLYAESFKHIKSKADRISFMVKNEKSRSNFEVVNKVTPRMEGEHHWVSFRPKNNSKYSDVDFYVDEELLGIIENSIKSITVPELLSKDELFWAWNLKTHIGDVQWENVLQTFISDMPHDKYTSMSKKVDQWYVDSSGDPNMEVYACSTERDIIHAIEVQLANCEF